MFRVPGPAVAEFGAFNKRKGFKNMKKWLVGLLAAGLCAASAVAATVTDTLNYAFTGISGTGYAEWSGKTSESDAVYAGQSGGANNSIQLRSNNSNSGIVTTKSGGKAKKVTVTWEGNTQSGRTLTVYGQNSAYSQATDLYNASSQGTSLGTIVCGTSTELTISGDYEFIGMRSASGAMYLSEVKIDWEVASSDQSVTLNPAGPIEAEVGDEVIITATADGFSGDVNWSWTGSGTPDGNRFTVDTSAAVEAATVTATATYGTDETASQSVTVTVVAPPPPSVTLEASATEVEVGDVVTVTATAANFSGEVTWEWAGDGSAVGNVFTVDTSVAGDHLIMVEATCGDESADAEVTITVKEPGVEEDYALVSSLDELSDGTAVILTDEGSNYALPATISGSVFGVTPVAPVNDVISTDDASIVWTLVSDGNGHFSLYSADAGKYAGHGGGGSSNSGQLQDDAFPHAIELDGGLFVFTATTADSSGNYRTLQFNQNGTNPRFAYYKGTQTDLKIYAKSTPPVVEPTVTLEASATEVEIGEEVTITATAENFDAPASDLIWEWKVGETVDPTQVGTTFTWAPSAAGSYTVTATATDGDNIDDDSVTITVNNLPTAHEIVVDAGEHGNAYADVETAYEGATVTLTVEPAPGYGLDTLTAKELTSEAPVAVDPDTLTFVMPDDDVYVEVTFKEVVTYTLVESADDVVVGADYVIVASGNGFTEALKNAANGTRIGTEAVTVSDDGKTIENPSDAIIWQIKPGVHKGQRGLFNAAANVYAAAPATAGNNAQLLADGTDDLAQWTIDFSAQSEVKIYSVSYDDRYLQRNNTAGNHFFATYSSAQATPRLYRADSTEVQTVTFDPNGGTYYDDMLTMKYVKGGQYWGVWKPAAREGYKFLGWFDEDGARVQNGQIITEDDTRTFTAQWVQLQTVTFDANGGTLRGMESKEFRCDGVYAGFAKPIRDGYTFMGWFSEDGERVLNGEAVTDDAERTLYAHWGQTVRFDGNGGTVRQEARTFDTAGVYAGFSMPTRDGWTFLGWFDENDQRVKNGEDVTEDGERTLYAHWKESATSLSISGFSVASRSAPAARDARSGGGQAVNLRFETVAGFVYEVQWVSALDGDWTVLKRWTAEDGVSEVTVTVPADSPSGFLRLAMFDEVE